MITLAQAETFARRKHAGQIEKYGGTPYVSHLERVVALVDSDEAKTIAWLHDVLEDTDARESDLFMLGATNTQVNEVLVLTRDKQRWTYAEYIRVVRDQGDRVAFAVKIADLRDHLRPDAPPIPVELTERYKKALRSLLRAEREG